MYKVVAGIVASFVIFYAADSMAVPRAFSDSFNRPNSETVGNGWSYFGNNEFDPIIGANRLTTPELSTSPNQSGIFRQYDLTAGAEIHARLTQTNGFGGELSQFSSSVSLFNSRQGTGGYEIYVMRSGSSTDSSRVALFHNNELLEEIYSPFQFNDSLNLKFNYSASDGRLQGRISDAESGWDFNFNQRISPTSSSTVGLRLSAPDVRSPEITKPTFDDFSISAFSTFVPPTFIGPVQQAPTVAAHLKALPSGLQLWSADSNSFSPVALSGDFDPSKKTIVLVHGWNGAKSILGAENPLDGWMKGLARDIDVREHNANVIAYDWYLRANSTDLGAGFVPNGEINREAKSLIDGIRALYSGIEAPQGNVQIIGHSLGAAIGAKAAVCLTGGSVSGVCDAAIAGITTEVPDVERVTLLDAPESKIANDVGGRVNIDGVVKKLAATPGLSVQSVISTLPALGYGKEYPNILNIDISLAGHSGIRDEWYKPTVLPGIFSPVVDTGVGLIFRDLPDGLGYDQSNGSIEADSNLARDYGAGVGLANPYKLTDTRTLGAFSAAVKKVVNFTEEALHSFSPGAGYLDLLPTGEITATTGSPIYAYFDVDIPVEAQYFEMEFNPLKWATEDLLAIYMDGQLVFWIDGAEFRDSWMSTGEIDLLPWLGKSVQFTIGYFSDAPGNSIVYRPISITQLQAVPLPGAGWLFLSAVGLLACDRRRVRSMASNDAMGRGRPQHFI
jgi:pimeloyl-ACP methyl ester carboxylesterase